MKKKTTKRAEEEARGGQRKTTTMWFRIVVMLAMIKGDNIEGALANVGYVMLSSSLHSISVGARENHAPETGETRESTSRSAATSEISDETNVVAFFSGELCRVPVSSVRVKRLTWFLLITTGVFPIFRCFAFPVNVAAIPRLCF